MEIKKIAAIPMFSEVRQNLLVVKRVIDETYPDRLACRKYLKEPISKFKNTGNINNPRYLPIYYCNPNDMYKGKSSGTGNLHIFHEISKKFPSKKYFSMYYGY